MALEAIGIAVASDLAKDHTKDLLVTVKRQAGYFFCFNNIAKDLGTKKDNLVLKRRGLLQRAEDANNNTEQISDEAQKWLEKAKKHIEEADNLEAETKKKRKCFLGWCPNCIWQYRLGRKMAEKIDEVVEQIENSEFNYFSRLRTLTGQGPDSSDDFIFFESRNVAYDKLLKALRDTKNFRIGLYGMGGLGKTSLVKEVQKQVMNSEPFDKVVFVVVSNPPDVRKIQEEIAESLRLKFEEQYESNRAQRLYMRLTNGQKILLILDDVWCKLDLQAIGIPHDDSHQGYCRVLLTTRKAQVCHSMNCQPQINLSELSKEDARILFKKHANIIEETTPNRLLVVARDIAEQCKGLPVAIAAVASTLRNQGLKVWEEALGTLKDSKTLDNIDADLMEIYRCLKLSFDNLKNKRAEELFLLCSLFPEDYEIPMEELIRYGIGLGIFGDEDSYGTLRFQVSVTKKKLIDSCMLLNASFETESVKMHDLVRAVAHLIAKNGIQVVIGLKKNLKAVLEDIMSKDIVKCLWLQINMIHETPDLLNCDKRNILDPLNWPELKILIMTVNVEQHFIDVSDVFFKGMETLQVLTLKRALKFQRSTMRIPKLINLQTLRLKNWALGDISIIRDLKRLKTLELEDCTIIELPDGILELKKLRLLGLFRCSVEKNPFGVMGRFSQLEELYFTKDYGDLQWKVDGENIFEFFDEKCCLRKLKWYYIQIGGDRTLYDSMDYLKPRGLYIQRFDASTSNATIKDLVQRAKILHLQDVQGGYKSITPDIVQAVGGLNELIEVQLDSCLEVECLLDTTNHSSAIGTMFSNLVKLRLVTMHSLKELCHGPSPSDFLQKLVTLDLHECSKLQNILFVGNLNLCNLKSMQVTDCPTLTSLFTLSTAQSLELLETLTITRCNGLKYIIADQRGRENEDNIVQEKDEHDQKISDGLMFPKLKYIFIRGCDSLEWIFPVPFVSGLKQLEEIRIREAAKLKNIFGQYQSEDHPLHENAKEIVLPSLRRMWLTEISNFISIFPIFYQSSDQPLQNTNFKSTALMELEKSTDKNSEWVSPLATAQCLSKQLLNLSLLRKLQLSSIPKLVSLFKLSTAQEMLLEYLLIENCRELKHMIANEEEDYDDNCDSVTVFSKLRTLVVRNCNLLKMLLPVSVAHGLVQLESIELEEAPQLEYIFGHDGHLSHRIENDIHIEFLALKNLDLVKLPRMISICSKNYYPTWPILKSLKLSKCPLFKISSIIDCITKKGSSENIIGDNQSRIEVQDLKNVLNFEGLYIEDDEELEGIFLLEGLPSSRQQTQWSSKLEDLTLKDLPKLRHICKTPLLLSFQNLEYLYVHGCGKLSYVFSACVLRNLPQLEKLSVRDCDQLEQIMEDKEDHKVCFPTLFKIEIKRCNKLKSLFSINISNELPRLQCLRIEEASQLEEVFRNKMCNVEDQLMFPSLSVLELMKLPSLVCVCRGFKLRSVKHLNLMDCPKLPSMSTATIEAFPHEYPNAEGKEAEDKELEEVAVKDRNAIGRNKGTDESREEKGKRPAETILISNEGKDPQTSTNAGIGITEDNHSVNECKEAKKQEKEEKIKAEMTVAETTVTIMGDNSASDETDNAIHQSKVNEEDHSEEKEGKEAKTEKREVALTANPTHGIDAAPHMTTKGHSEEEKSKEAKEREEGKFKGEEDVGVKDWNAIGLNKGTDESRKDEGKQPAKTVLSSYEGKAPQTSTNAGMGMTEDNHSAPVESSSQVAAQSIQIPTPTVVPHTWLPSVSLAPVNDLSPEFDPLISSTEQLMMASAEEYANFRDIGAIKKKHILLLEKAITKYPSLWTWREKFKRLQMKRFGYTVLGDMLEFLASTRWRDVTKEKKAEFDSLLNELETFGFDVQWLGNTHAMIEQRNLDEKTINRMKTLELQVKGQEIEVQKAKEKLQKTQSELDAIRAEVEKLEDFIGF